MKPKVKRKSPFTVRKWHMILVGVVVSILAVVLIYSSFHARHEETGIRSDLESLIEAADEYRSDNRSLEHENDEYSDMKRSVQTRVQYHYATPGDSVYDRFYGPAVDLVHYEKAEPDGSMTLITCKLLAEPLTEAGDDRGDEQDILCLMTVVGKPQVRTQWYPSGRCSPTVSSGGWLR